MRAFIRESAVPRESVVLRLALPTLMFLGCISSLTVLLLGVQANVQPLITVSFVPAFVAAFASAVLLAVRFPRGTMALVLSPILVPTLIALFPFLVVGGLAVLAVTVLAA